MTKDWQEKVEQIIERLVEVSLAPNKTTELANELVKQALQDQLDEVVEMIDGMERGNVYDKKTKKVFYWDDAVKAIKKRLYELQKM